MKPNVTVDFKVDGGNLTSIKWPRDTVLSTVSSNWDVYVHDVSESVPLQSYAMEMQSKLTVIPEPTDFLQKKKAVVIPKITVLPKSSRIHSCNSSILYSHNMCNIRHTWKVRFLQMKKDHGERFDCQLPGIWVHSDHRRPVCSKYQAHSPNDSLGFFEVMGFAQDYFKVSKKATLTHPPIGVHKDTSGCVAKCSSYFYHLVEEDAYHDETMQLADLYLYFVSNTIETRTEYRLLSLLGLLSEIGGMMGLVLGASLCSVSMLLIDGASKVLPR